MTESDCKPNGEEVQSTQLQTVQRSLMASSAQWQDRPVEESSNDDDDDDVHGNAKEFEPISKSNANEEGNLPVEQPVDAGSSALCCNDEPLNNS